MKTIITVLKGLYVLVVCTVLMLFMYGGLPHSQLPPGWGMEKCGNWEYRFIRPNGLHQQFPSFQLTRLGTIARAWRQYNFEKDLDARDPLKGGCHWERIK